MDHICLPLYLQKLFVCCWTHFGEQHETRAAECYFHTQWGGQGAQRRQHFNGFPIVTREQITTLHASNHAFFMTIKIVPRLCSVDSAAKWKEERGVRWRFSSVLLIKWRRTDGYLNVNRLKWIYTVKVAPVLPGILMNVYCAPLQDVVEYVCLAKEGTRGQHSVPSDVLTASVPPQPSSPRGCPPPGRARRARRPCTTTAPRTRTTGSTTPRWTGESSCATPGTWSPLSGKLPFHCTARHVGRVVCLSVGRHAPFQTAKSDWVTVFVHE